MTDHLGQVNNVAMAWSPDPQTGVLVRQVAAHPSLNHHPYFYIPAYDDAMRWLFFVSHRTGRPQAFAQHRPDGEVLQLTHRADLNEWSIHPSHDGRFVYYTAGTNACRVDLETRREELLADFSSAPMMAQGTVADAMGTTTLSHDDRWWAITIRQNSGSRLCVLDTATGAMEYILEAASVFHPEFHPNDASLLRYSGPHDARIWVVRRDGSDNRLVYQRNAARKEWVVHETWIPGRRELLAVDWPYGLFRVSIDDGLRTEVSGLNAWHPVTDRAGRRIVTDTRNPDRGICLLELDTVGDTHHVVCLSQASSLGEHWNANYCPYDDGPIQVYAPQHTHPHPSFSPDGRFVVFTTDRSGWSEVMEVDLQSCLGLDRHANRSAAAK